MIDNRSVYEPELSERIAALLNRLEIPSNLRGYYCLHEALMIAMEEPDSIYSMTKTIYPQVAAYLRSSPECVERDMRHAIRTAWNQKNSEALHELFGNTVSPTKGKPTNGEFISLLAEQLRMEKLPKEFLYPGQKFTKLDKHIYLTE